MALLIDTSALIDLERVPDSDILRRAVGDEGTAISVITVSELLHGVARASDDVRPHRQAFVEHVIAGFDPVPITEPVARIHSDLWATLAARGRMIGAHDSWIAATALAHGFGVVTTDVSDFERVPGLRLIPIGRDNSP